MHTFLQDVRFACRKVAQRPGFALVAILTLALGIGANVTIFSVVNAVLLRPLPFPEPERLVNIWEASTRNPGDANPIAYPNFEDWRSGNAVFERMAVCRTGDFTLTDRNLEAAHVQGALVSANLFATLGVRPALGRAFLPAEDAPGTRVVILSHALWQKRFGGDAAVLGRTLALDRQSYEIVGVMPAGFRYPIQNTPVELWTTIAADREPLAGEQPPLAAQRDNTYLGCIARLKPGFTLLVAQANLNAIGSELARRYPETNADQFPKAVALLADLTDEVRPALWILLGAAGCVLVIACVNVANLLLARATTRQKEIGIRAALGAGRLRIVRQLLTEHFLLALLAGVAGLLLALWGTAGVVALLPENFPRAAEIAPDGRVLGFTLLVSLLTGVLFGLAPAWRISRAEPAAVLGDAAGRGAGGGGGRRAGRLRGALVVAELTLTFVLLVGSGLLIRSFWQLQSVPPGFDPRGVLTAKIALPESSDPQAPVHTRNYYQALLERVSRLPGVRSASAVFPLPMSGANWQPSIEIAGRATAPADRPFVQAHAVAPGFFGALGIPLRRGRDFDARDSAEAPGVVIVNETFARRFFPGENPLGQRVTPQVSLDAQAPLEREIVGVVGDVKFRRLTGGDRPGIFLPHAQYPLPRMTLLARTETRPPGALLPALRGAAAEVDATVPLYEPRALTQYLAASVAQPRLNMAILLIVAGVAATLTALGVYSVMAYAVAQRTQEIGIRMALGAQRSDVIRLIVGQGARLTLLGVGFGIFAALGLTRFLGSLLFGVSAGDPLTFLAIGCFLTLVTLLACYLPARHATRVDPIIALRAD